MTDVRLTSDLYDSGLAKYDLTRLVRTGELDRVRRGVYSDPLADGATATDRHLRLVAAAVPLLDQETVVSHGSAAILHGLPGWVAPNGRVHVTRPRTGGGQRRRFIHLNTAPLAPSDVALVGAVRATSMARTVLDLGRTTSFWQAVASGDRALALGLDPDELQAGLLRMTRWPGVRAARRTCAMLDGRSESVGESFSRVRFVEQAIPAPQLQYEVYDEAGYLLARCDFGWEEQRTLGEFDGKVKYGQLLRSGQLGTDVLFAEKKREDALRDRGWQIVRWTWDDLQHPEVLRDRILRAFVRADAVPAAVRQPINRPYECGAR